MKVFLVNGVPTSLQQDAWWMSAGGTSGETGPEAVRFGDGGVRMSALAGLVALADVLIWQVVPGLSLAAFLLVLVTVAAMALPAVAPGKGARAAAVTLVCVLPLVEQVQALSLAIALVGTSTALVLLVVTPQQFADIWAAVLRLWQVMMRQPLDDLRHGMAHALARGPDRSAALRGLARIGALWAVPLGLGLVFVLLFAGANPVWDTWFQRLSGIGVTLPRPGRMMFWAVAALAIWPCLALHGMRHRLALPLGRGHARPRPRLGVLNAGSVIRSLILFNLIFAVQTSMDTAILTGGAALPQGMSWAEYAHRGAYPLLGAALLAGAFAMISRPFARDSREVKALLILWLIQTVFLVCSSLFRLESYIDAYGLSRLRLAAVIWMGTVAAGLILIGWQVAAGRANTWLLARLGLLGGAVLYTCAFISFDASIARHNIDHGRTEDRFYICGLGPAALPAIRAHEARTGTPFCPAWRQPQAPSHRDWREWGFRDWRVLRSLDVMSRLNAKP